MEPLGSLGGEGVQVWDINADGSVVGMIVGRASAGSAKKNVLLGHAFRYHNGAMTDLGTLGGNQSSAAGINNSADVVGTADLGGRNGGSTSFLYLDALSQMFDLDQLIVDQPADAINFVPLEVNDSLDIAGHVEVRQPYGSTQRAAVRLRAIAP